MANLQKELKQEQKKEQAKFNMLKQKSRWERYLYTLIMI